MFNAVLEPTINAGNKAMAGVNGNDSAPWQLSAQHSATLVYTDEFDPSVTLYNLAVCWFHLHEHAKAFSILEGLFQNIEPIDEEIAKRICLLLLDVALLTQKAARSALKVRAFSMGDCVRLTLLLPRFIVEASVGKLFDQYALL